MTDEELLMEAVEARKAAYTPYSHYQVGAALLAEDGRVYTGCNIENAAYSATICAERTAFVKAVSEGQRSFVAIAVVGGPEGEDFSVAPPCGTCRQVMAEFCRPDFRIILGDWEGYRRVYTLQEMLPVNFTF